MIHHTGTDRESTFATVVNQGKATADRTGHWLQVIEIDAAGSVTQKLVGIAAYLNAFAHNAQQYRAAICQHGVVVHRVPYGAASKFIVNHVITFQAVIERVGDIIVYHLRHTALQPKLIKEGLIDLSFDVYYYLVYTTNVVALKSVDDV